MNISIALPDGGSIIVYEKGGAVWYQRLDANQKPILHETKVTDISGGDAMWIGATPSSSGSGYSVMWQTPGGGLFAQDYDSGDRVTGAAHAISSVPADTGGLAFTSAASIPTVQNGATTGSSGPVVLADGGRAMASDNHGVLTIDRTDANGQAVGPTYTLAGAFANETYSNAALTPLANGGYAALFVHQADGSHWDIQVIRFAANGYEQDQLTVYHNSGNPGSVNELSIAGLPDGGFVVAWGMNGPTARTDAIAVQEYTADGQRLGASPTFVGSGFLNADAIQVLADGRYGVSWHDPFAPNGAQDSTTTFTEAGASLNIRDPAPGGQSPPPSPPPPPAPGDEQLQAVGAAVALGASAGWTGAGVLSNHTLAVVAAQDGGYGSHVGAEQTYDASGAETQSTTLSGYAPAGQALNAHLTALQGGFYEVTYDGTTDYEIYNANDQLVFSHNQYTSPTAAFAPLLNGGYVTTDSNSHVFGLFDANNANVGWFALPAGAPSTPTVNALPDGDFVFTYAGSREMEVYDPSGHLVRATSWGGAVHDYAMGFAPIGASGFLGAWIGDSVGPPGPGSSTTAVNIEEFLNDGSTITRTITVAQDLDPWHTQFVLQSHADQSVAILWSQGGAVWASEYANGAASPAYAVGVAANLSDLRTIALSDNQVGLAWMEGGDAWAEIFDPATGTMHRADLGAAGGDLSTLHLLATANGGLAVSWHTGTGAIEGAVLDASGHLGAPVTLAGDLLGVDSQGHAVTLHDQAGVPVLQPYTVNDTLFWHV